MKKTVLDWARTLALGIFLGTATFGAIAVLAEEGEMSSDVGMADALPTEPTEDELHDQLRALRADMEAAMNSRDLDAILANVDENVVFTTMNNDVVVGRDAVADYFDKMMNGPDKVVDSVTASFVPEALSILHGGDTAISWGHTEDHYRLASGQELDISARWSGTMVRRDGRWVVASFHYSTNMFDNPVLSAQRRILLGGGTVVALVCLGLGFFLGRRRS